jgi:hypothetical protein
MQMALCSGQALRAPQAGPAHVSGTLSAAQPSSTAPATPLPPCAACGIAACVSATASGPATNGPPASTLQPQARRLCQGRVVLCWCCSKLLCMEASPLRTSTEYGQTSAPAPGSRG